MEIPPVEVASEIAFNANLKIMIDQINSDGHCDHHVPVAIVNEIAARFQDKGYNTILAGTARFSCVEHQRICVYPFSPSPNKTPDVFSTKEK